MSISLFLVVKVFAIASLAFSFATGFTFPIAVVASVCALSTAVSVVATSTFAVAAVAASFALAIAAVFSASDKFVSALIASSLALRAASIAFLAASFLATTGLSAAIAVVPDSLAVSNAFFAVAPLIAVNAFSLSAFTLAIAAAFSSSVAFGVELIAAIFSVAAVFTASIAGCLSKVTKSDNGFVSVEPSLYVTTRFPALSFVNDLILESLSVTGESFEIFASSFFLLYSSCSFSLILSKSASVTLAGSVTATFSVGVAISYLDV